MNTSNKTEIPLSYYQTIYQSLDPLEIARKCNLEFNGGAFNLRVMGTEYRVSHPEFALLDNDGSEVHEAYEKILFIRYLCEGKYFPSQGKQLSYNEFPWGALYYSNFKGRCLKRFANTFGRDIPAFVKMIEQNPQLRAAPLKIGDAAYRLEFCSGLYVSLILWQADDEFSPSAQILFDDNFVFAFTAEDLAVVGEVLVNRLKKLLG
ncbi:MAG: DUF3786 domain-containing protein [Treponema sp.]|nr:DUF3786 domain-containing protein [Treponema sp.]